MIIQFFLSLVLVLALLMTWRRMRQQAIRFVEALFWSAVWAGALVLVWWPGVSTTVAHFVGIGRGADLVLYVSIILLFILVFQLFVAQDRTERHLTDLVRHEALNQIESIKSIKSVKMESETDTTTESAR